MDTLSQFIENTKNAIISITSREMNSVDDREERDRDLDNLQSDIEHISDGLQLEPQEVSSARNLATMLIEAGETGLSRDLQIGIAYAENQSA